MVGGVLKSTHCVGINTVRQADLKSDLAGFEIWARVRFEI
jgi:hypothetical protein